MVASTGTALLGDRRCMFPKSVFAPICTDVSNFFDLQNQAIIRFLVIRDRSGQF